MSGSATNGRLERGVPAFPMEAGAVKVGGFEQRAERSSPGLSVPGLHDDGTKAGRAARFYAPLGVASRRLGGEDFEKECGIPAFSIEAGRHLPARLRSNGTSLASPFETFAAGKPRHGV